MVSNQGCAIMNNKADEISAKTSGDETHDTLHTSISATQRLAIRVRRNGIRRTLAYLLFVVIGEKCGFRIQRRFEFDRDSTGAAVDVPAGYVVAVVSCAADLTADDVEFLKSYGEWSAFLDRFSYGRKCLALRTSKGVLACVCWFGPLDESSASVGIIDHCFTRYDFRGRGLYSWAIRQIATSEDANIGMRLPRLFIECSPFNHSSRQGIVKAGFSPRNTTVFLFGRPVISWKARD